MVHMFRHWIFWFCQIYIFKSHETFFSDMFVKPFAPRTFWGSTTLAMCVSSCTQFVLLSPCHCQLWALGKKKIDTCIDTCMHYIYAHIKLHTRTHAHTHTHTYTCNSNTNMYVLCHMHPPPPHTHGCTHTHSLCLCLSLPPTPHPPKLLSCIVF